EEAFVVLEAIQMVAHYVHEDVSPRFLGELLDERHVRAFPACGINENQSRFGPDQLLDYSKMLFERALEGMSFDWTIPLMKKLLELAEGFGVLFDENGTDLGMVSK